MSGPIKILTAPEISNLFSIHPQLQILVSPNYADYIELTSNLRAEIDRENARIEESTAIQIITQYFSQSRFQLINIDAKVRQFLNDSYEKYCTLKYFVDGNIPYIILTPNGRNLLAMVSDLIQDRVRYSASNTEGLLNMARLVQNGQDKSPEQALLEIQSQIEQLNEQAERIKREGESAVKEIFKTASLPELLSQLADSADNILRAAQYVKREIKDNTLKTEKEFLEQKLSVGGLVETKARFYKELFQSPIYQSYVKAYEMLSYLNEKESGFEILKSTVEFLKTDPRLVPGELDTYGFLSFQAQFEAEVRAIEFELSQQIAKLQMRVQAALDTKGGVLGESLNTVIKMLIKERDTYPAFLSSHPFVYEFGLSVNAGEITMPSYELEEPLILDLPTVAQASADAEAKLFAEIAAREQAIIKVCVADFKKQLSRGPIKLSTIEYNKGFIQWWALYTAASIDRELDFKECEEQVGFTIVDNSKRIISKVYRNDRVFFLKIKGYSA